MQTVVPVQPTRPQLLLSKTPAVEVMDSHRNR
jgi:hypothetical protein